MASNGMNESGAKHLTSLDFDLSDIWRQFEELQAQLPLKAKEIGEKTSIEMKKSMEESMKKINTTSFDNYSSGLINTEKFKAAREEMNRIAETYGKMAKSAVKYNEATKLFTGTITYDDEQGNKVIAYYKQVQDAQDEELVRWEAIKQESTENYQQQEKLSKKLHDTEIKNLAEQRTYEEKLAKQKAEEYQKQILQATGVRDAETLSTKERIETQDRWLKRLELEDKQRNKTIQQVDKMIAKQKQFSKEMSTYKASVVNKQVIADNDKYVKGLENLSKKLKDNKISAKDARNQIEDYKNKFNELNSVADKTVGGVDNFLKVLSDKARWLAAFELITLTMKAFEESLTVIKETEDAVVELQRVMNTDIGASSISKGLYQIASDFGRTFNEVQEVAVKFAQTGMEWDEVLTATRNTMLALNTAELEITSSTEGLIAIQSQWKLETEDLIDVIDKVNITADNFTVTSEKLVAALQRVSGTAKNSGFSLEETIGVITALSEATGRSGENIGTALNSLIAYTKKESSLKVFAGLSDEMAETVRQVQSGATSIYDLWKNLSKELNALSKEQQNALLQSITQDTEYSEFAEELESQATEVTQSIQEVYKTAGTFRQNYFVALLNDIGVAEEVLTNMGDSAGYSLSENEKYMETLTAKINQLKTVLGELAVQFGESGALEFLKLLTDSSIAVLKLTKDVGGLNVIIVNLLSLLFMVKKVNIISAIVGMIGGVKSLVFSLKELAVNFSFATLKAKMLTLGTETLGVALNGVAFATTFVVGAFSYFNSKMEEARQKSLANAESYKEQAKGIAELKSEYEELTKNMSDEELKNADLSKIKDELIRKYGVEKEALDALNDSREKGIELLDITEQKKLTSSYYEISDELEKAKKAMTDLNTATTSFTGVGISKRTKDILSTYGIGTEVGIGAGGATTLKLIPDESINDLSQFKAQLQEISLVLEQNGENTEWLDGIIRKITKSTDKWGETYSKLGIEADYIVKAMGGEGTQLDELREAVNDTESFKNFKNAAIEAAEGFKPLEELVSQAVDDLFPELSKVTEETAEETRKLVATKEYLEQLSTAYDELNSSIDNYQKGLDAVYGAIEEYNQNQYLSIDTIQQLTSLGWDYIKMLEFTADGVKINEQYAKELANSNQSAMEKVLKNAEAQAVLATATRYLSDENEELKSGLQDLPSNFDLARASLDELSTAYVNGAISAQQFAMSAFGEDFDQKKFNAFQSELNQISKTFDGLRNSMGKSTTAWSNGAKNASKAVSDAQKKQLEEQKKAIKERYQAEIDALKQVEKENDRIRKQEEYYRKRKEAENNLEKAKTRSGVEYREQEQEALQQLEDIEREWKEQLEDWSIEDKISELEKLRDAEIALIDAQINRIGNTTSTIAQNTVKVNSQANEEMLGNYEEEYLEPIAIETTSVYSEIFNELPSQFGDAGVKMLDIAKFNSVQLYNIYNQNFISKMRDDLINMQAQMMGLGGVNWFKTGYGNMLNYNANATSTTNYNNSTRNNNVYANIYNNSTAKNFGSSIFNKP